MKRLLISVCSASLYGFVGASVQAHHSFAVHFDPTGLASVQGTVADIRIRSPHSFLELDVQGEDGTVQRWEVETHSIPLLRRVNIDQDTFQIGQTLTVSGMPSRIPDRPLIFGLVFETDDGMAYQWAGRRKSAQRGLNALRASGAMKRTRIRTSTPNHPIR